MRLTRAGAGLAALALVGAIALAACGKASTTGTAAVKGYQGIPAPSSHKVSGGTVTFGMPSGDVPTYMLPIVPAASSSVYTISLFQYLMWRPLWWTPSGHTLNVDYGLSLASKPTITNGNKTAVINLKTNYKWSDGQPVDAQNVIFYINLLKGAVKLSPANSGNYTPGLFPDNVASAKATGKYQVTINFTKAYNPSFLFLNQLALIIPLPLAWDVTKFGNAADSGGCLTDTAADKWKKCEAVYTYLNAQSTKPATFATNPLWQVVDGPFKLSQFNASTDANTLVPNTAYTGPSKPTISAFQEVAYTSDAAEFNAIESGSLDFGLVPSSNYAQIPHLKTLGYNVFGFPDYGWDYILLNFADTTNHWNNIVGQLYVRQALAHLVDSAGYIKGIYHGYAVTADGPVPPEPVSPFTPSNAKSPVYPFSVSAAKSLLAAHGWKIVNGVQTCQKAGSAASDCGTGIPSGATLAFTLYYNNGSPAVTAEDTDLASQANSAGIKITLVGKDFNYLLQNFTQAPSSVNKWQASDFGGFTESAYPTTESIFNTGGSYNFSSYNSAEANKLINNSVYGSNPHAVNTEAGYLAENLPALFQPEADHVYAWKNTLSGPQASFWEVPQFGLNPEQWYFTKK
jgi:peptide/nickel transport system substrate-binding protein